MSRMASIFARSVARSVARSGRTARGRRPTTRALPQPRRRTARQQLLVVAYAAQASADAYRREVLERDTAVPSDTLLAGAPAERAVVVFCAGALFTISHVMARHWLFCLLTLLFLAVVIH